MYLKMKKITFKNSLIAIFIALAVMSFGSIANAQVYTATDHQMLEKLLQANSVTLNEVQNPQDSENLYLQTMYSTKFNPIEKAMSSLSSTVSLPNLKTGKAVFFSTEDWELFNANKGIDVLIEKLSADNSFAVINILDHLQGLISDEIEMEAFAEELASFASISEKFSDGDTSNSGGFDLLTDLQIIEKILFYTVEPSTVDSARSSQGLPALPSVAPNETVEFDEVDESETEPNNDDITQYIADNTPKTGSANQGFAVDAMEYPTSTPPLNYNSLGINAAECNATPQLKSAFDDFFTTLEDDEKMAFEPILKDKEKEVSTDSSTLVIEESETPDEEKESSRNVFTQVEPAKKYEWESEEICSKNKIICIEIKFINNGQECDFETDSENACASVEFGGFSQTNSPQSDITEETNCFACHITYMTDLLNTAISKTLTPSKVPGNLFESGKCKKSFFSVKPSINFFMIAKPIPFPEDADLIFQSANPFDSFDSLYSNKNGKTNLNSKVDAYTSHFASVKNKTAINLVSQVSEAKEAIRKAEKDQQYIDDLYQEIDGEISGHQDILERLEEMNSNLRSFDTIFTQMSENVCNELKSKKTCE